jgi:Fe-S cluster assembly protein SufD
LRDRAAARFGACDFPTSRWEEWRYTDTRALSKRLFEPLEREESARTLIDIGPYLLDHLKSHRLVFVDGKFAPALSRRADLPAGVVVAPLAHALPEHVDVIESHLARHADLKTHPFVALNTMMMIDGVYVHVPAGVTLDAPIHVLFFGAGEGGASHLRNLVIADEGAQVALVEHYAGVSEAQYWTNAVTEIVAGPNTSVEHYKLEEEGAKAFHIASIDVHQHRDSRFASHNISIGGRLVRNDINTRLDGENAHCDLNGLYVLRGRQHVDNHTRIEHVKPRAVSRELYKGVLDGWSRGVFNGKVIVHKDAQQIDSNQANHNLLLSPNAEADPKPQLEIFADDVKCTHGATVGQLDESSLYYLRSRGIVEEDARALLTHAFANEVITRMRLEPLRARVENLIKTRLPSEVL